MIKFLCKIFVKDYDKPHLPRVREKYGVFASIVGIITNCVLAAIKLLAGLLSGSISIIADALNNLTDSGTAIMTFVSFKIAAKPADKDHPFGHARIEYICSMVVAFLILIVGSELFAESVGGLFNGEGADRTYSTLTFIILGVSVALKLLLSLFYSTIAKTINSTVLRASRSDSLSDSISTLAILISSIIIKYTGAWYIDSIVGAIVSVMIIIAGIKILNETKNSILGEAPVQDVLDNIKAIIDKYDEVIGVHDMIVHNYGPNHYIASFHAEVDGSKDIYILHDEIDNLEKEINTELGILCTVHMDPIVTNDATVNELREFVNKTIREKYPEITTHDFRVVIGNTHTNLIFDVVVPYDTSYEIKALCDEIKELILTARPNHYCVITVDRE